MSIILLLLLVTVSNTSNLLKGRQSSDVLEYTCSPIVSAIFNVINDIKKTQRPRRMSKTKTSGRDRACLLCWCYKSLDLRGVSGKLFPVRLISQLAAR
ncbi:unnamed protein product [Lasius platythorax]|uniref:Secreted protein n=1 Tax=Lasius platythorax TaxID=488582 RepID=A0AAV2NLC0_9HYME